jgi:cytochrome b6-f complex iron-sulfur subunit
MPSAHELDYTKAKDSSATPQLMKTTRREFIIKAGIATACTCAGVSTISGCNMIRGKSAVPAIPEQSYRLEGPDLVIDLKGFETLQTPNGCGKLAFEHQGENIKVVIINTGRKGYKAFADRCTHGGRELNYKPADQIMECSSFSHSKFDLTGNRLAGPAEDPLTTYPLEQMDDQLVVRILATG